MKPKHPNIQSVSLFGRIIAPRHGSSLLTGYRVQGLRGAHLLAETTTDALGRFLLEWPAEAEKSEVSVRVFSPWGDSAGELRLAPAELVSPRALTFSAVAEPRLVPQAFEPGARQPFSSEIVSDGDLSRFQQAVGAAVQAGYLREGDAGWVEHALADLDHAHRLGRASVEGDFHSLEMLRRFLRVEPRWEISLGSRHIDGRRAPHDMGDCFVSPRDPLPFIWAGAMLDGFGGDFGWSERAAGFFNSRVLPVNAAFNAAVDWAEGRHSPKDFAGIVKSYDPAGFGQRTGRSLPQLPELGFCLSERNVCLGAFLFDLQQYGSQSVSNPPTVGSVVPDAVCAGSVATVSLLPPTGSQFPATEPSEWSLAIDGQPVTIQSWDPGEVVISFPATVKAGCQAIRWVHGLDPEFVNHLREIGEQCAPFFGGSRAWANFPLTIGQTAVDISVVGTPQIRRFTADGLTSLVAEACVDVNLAWEADLAICAGSGAYMDVTLLADGNLRAAALSSTDSLIVNDEATTTFAIRVEAYDGATLCSFAERTLQVQRYKAVHLIAPLGSCVDAGSTLPVGARLSCPAPAGGIAVTLASTNPMRLGGGTIMIPEGSVEESIDLSIGLECGEVTITATAPGHQSASFKRVVSSVPQITAITPPEVDACDEFQVWLDGSCFGENVGEQQAFLTDGSGGSIAGTIIQLQGNTRLLVEFPALYPGQYPVSVTFCGKTGSANSLLVVKEKAPVIKMFSASPSQLAVCPASITLTWRVESARGIRILRDGVLIPGSERIQNEECGLWEESFTDPQLQSNAVQYTLEAYPLSGSPVKTAQAPVTSPAHTMFLGLSQQSATSFIYNNTAPDPLILCQIKHAVITKVTNNSGRDLSLAHGGPGSVFIIIGSGGSTTAFNGAVVEGNWTAQVGGSSTSLPAQVTIKIDWKTP